MKSCILTKDMRPNGRAGDTIYIPGAMADKLMASGEARDAKPWPEVKAETAEPVVARPSKSYQTKDRR